MACIGVDLDGVLADFVNPYITRILSVTGEDHFAGHRPDAAWPTVWEFDQHAGYTHEQLRAVWKSIMKDPLFWQHLPPLAGASEALHRLSALRHDGHDIYFVTSRPGVAAKRQSEAWLIDHGMTCPTVIISSNKAGYVVDLGMDVYIDDRLDATNLCMASVRGTGRPARIYLKDAPYNQREVAPDQPWSGSGPTPAVVAAEDLAVYRDPALIVVTGVMDMLKREGLAS